MTATQPPPPPISTWGHIWRTVLVVAISLVGWVQLASWQWEHARWWLFLDLGLGALALALSFWRRRRPVAVAALTALMSSISALSGGPATLALMSLATRRRLPEILPVALLSLACYSALEIVNPTTDEDGFFTGAIIVSVICITTGWGMYIGSRRELLATLRDRADSSESEQSMRLDQARQAERTRIAREMHDVLAHRISMIALHSGAMTFRTDLSADEMRVAAGIIQDNSHLALTELREVLGILRDGPGDANPDLPQPSAEDIAQLIGQARATGLRVLLTDTREAGSVSESTGRTMYRVVQEGLTNARKHAQDTTVSITLTGTPASGIAVELSNPLHLGDSRLQTPASGLGLVGLEERVELAGGTLTHEVTPARAFVLRAWLPWRTIP
ncbi:sensor histidine kinase [Tomitella biformata]|uniref:sensor histidine kinase n=1 Tax=Tomitella biformata TaxID=630403 RepID=UPI00046452B1|nr:histidine kinase [Tomitella biformata]